MASSQTYRRHKTGRHSAVGQPIPIGISHSVTRITLGSGGGTAKLVGDRQPRQTSPPNISANTMHRFIQQGLGMGLRLVAAAEIAVPLVCAQAARAFYLGKHGIFHEKPWRRWAWYFAGAGRVGLGGFGACQ